MRHHFDSSATLNVSVKTPSGGFTDARCGRTPTAEVDATAAPSRYRELHSVASTAASNASSLLFSKRPTAPP